MAKLRSNRSREPEGSFRRRLVRRFRGQRIPSSAPPRNRRGLGSAGHDLRVGDLTVRTTARTTRTIPTALANKLEPVDLVIAEREDGEPMVLCRLDLFESVLRRALAGEAGLVDPDPGADESEPGPQLATGIQLRVVR